MLGQLINTILIGLGVVIVILIFAFVFGFFSYAVYMRRIRKRIPKDLIEKVKGGDEKEHGPNKEGSDINRGTPLDSAGSSTGKRKLKKRKRLARAKSRT